MSNALPFLPEPDSLAEDQHLKAMARLHEDKSLYPRFTQLESLAELTGPLAPGELMFVAGGTGNGKSLLCQNLFDDLVSNDIPTLYIGTEQSPDVLKIKHACIRTGVSPRLVLKPTPDEMNSLLYSEAVETIEAELRRLMEAPMRQRAFYANTEYVNREQLSRWIIGGVEKYGIECAIVDHIDQVSHGTGQNSVHELTQTVQHLHDIARQVGMPIIVASQIKRSTDPFKRHAPPDESDLAGSSSKERIMALGVAVWRPLRTDLPITELRELLRSSKQGTASGDRIYQPNTMGVRKIKDRLGMAPGAQCFLHVGKGGRLSDDPALTHGIRTGGIT